MPRVGRIIIPEAPHHITQRGNRQQDIFLDDDDRQTYLRLLSSYARQERLSIQGYCLMSNHLHLLVNPRYIDSLPRTLRAVHTCYAQYANSKYDWTGHIFASRYYSCPLDEVHFWSALRYVEQNPVRAGMVKEPLGWAWSSAPAHCGVAVVPFLDLGPMIDWPPQTWLDWIRTDDPEHDHALRTATRSGRPHGPQAFVEKVAKLLGVEFPSKPPGRPKGKPVN